MTPTFPRLLLSAVASSCDREFVLGDLEEEFVCLRREAGLRAASRWYTRQAFGSIGGLISIAIRRGEWTPILLWGFFAGALPLLVLDRLWCFVYSQIPLKAGLDRAPVFLLLNLAFVLVAAWVAVRSTRQAFAISVFATIALCVSVSAAPLWYAAAVVLCAPVLSVRRRVP